MLLSQLLELRSVLLFLFAKTSTLIFFLGSHELSHKLVSFGGCLIVDLLALFDNLGGLLVAPLIANGQRCITSIVSVKDVNSGVLDDIGEHFNVSHVPGHQVQDIRTCARLLDRLVGVLGEKGLDDIKRGLG